MKRIHPILLGLAAVVLLVGTHEDASAQVVREEGVASVAGLMTASYADYTFSSAGGEILFATLDADVYQTWGRGEGHEDDGGGGTGCEDEGGPGGMCLQVLDKDGTLVCFADRPMRPGWQRDPRLACALPKTRTPATYTLRIALRGEEGSCGQTASYPPPAASAKPYLLDVSLRRIAPEGPIERAIGMSHSRL